MITALEALNRLREGNHRFVSNDRGGTARTDQARRSELMAGQEPFAIVLGCSDSRVPIEIILDQGLGDLFVIRVAGNIATPTQVASIEYAATHFHSPLIVVLGHTMCGAILAFLDEFKLPDEDRSPEKNSIFESIRPSVEPLLAPELGYTQDALVQHAVRANISASVRHLRNGSQILREQIQREELLVVGAEYSLETGVVEFFADPQEVEKSGSLN